MQDTIEFGRFSFPRTTEKPMVWGEAPDGSETLNGERIRIHDMDSDDDCRRWTVESLDNPRRCVAAVLGQNEAIIAFVERFQ